MNLEPTNRELEVLSLAADGLTNTEIAVRLGITLETVKSHLRMVAEKLGTVRVTGEKPATTRAYSAAVAIRRGLI